MVDFDMHDFEPYLICAIMVENEIEIIISIPTNTKNGLFHNWRISHKNMYVVTKYMPHVRIDFHVKLSIVCI